MPSLKATYSSPTNPPFTVDLSIAPLPSSAETDAPSTATADRTRYLTDLGKSVVKMQDMLDAELTARMEEDKAREAAAAESGEVAGKNQETPTGRATKSNSKSTARVDEEKEEENYGEEVPEEDD